MDRILGDIVPSLNGRWMIDRGRESLGKRQDIMWEDEVVICLRHQTPLVSLYSGQYWWDVVCPACLVEDGKMEKILHIWKDTSHYVLHTSFGISYYTEAMI